MNTIQYSSRPIAIDFFAGAGGLSLGLEQAGFDVVLAVDRDGYHTATHERNFPYGVALCASVAELSASHVRAVLGTDREIDLIAGGPPCQGFSHMGFRDAADPRNTLVDQFVRLVTELQPRAFLMENVPGMQTGATGEIFERAVRTFEGSGYALTLPVRTLNAYDYGVPQKRERLFLLGVRSDAGRIAVYPAGPCLGQPPRPDVLDAIGDLPRIGEHPELYSSDSVAYDRQPQHPYAAVARGDADDPSNFSYRRSWNRSVCTGAIAVRHSEDAVALYAATPPGQMVPGHKLPRLNPKGAAPTLRAGSESEHGSHTAPRPIHPLEARCITAREAARLHGYPDWFRFYPGKWHSYRQIGNSVCPPVARALGRAVMESLGYSPEQPPGELALTDDFLLPANRPKQQRRITQTEEWPKIVLWLVDRAVNTRGTLVRPDFSVDDVENAYQATGAKMPRTPARRFLADIARSRNVQKLVKPATDRKLSIVPVDSNGVYGRFVPFGTPGAIGERDSIIVGSAELASAETIRPLKRAETSGVRAAEYLAHKSVAERLFGPSARVRLQGQRNLLGELAASDLRFKVTKDGRRRKGIVLLANRGAMPKLSQVENALARANHTNAVVVAPLTAQHFAVVLLTNRAGRVIERRRHVFRVAADPLDDGKIRQASEAVPH